jgi:hypothetical protein
MSEPPILDFLPHVPTAETRELVAQLVACSIDHDSICYVIKANPVELKLHYANELKHGLAHCTAQMQSAVFRAGVAGDMKAAQFWLRSVAGWREAARVDPNAQSTTIAAADKQQLIDRIVSMLTPEQAVALVKQEAIPAQSTAKPTLN